ncbi:hypothetical protein Indivirus_1_191 [Indivirus ILV1]|uniref:Uncharacterized protein n=1 Tax=Indivirus ILV1 TaxID=1977633 RepID=A0A1V0SD41_9VIRU|nr:hypothetical protein Indivirus_1_191 [Indivirus ILV1]
MVFGYVVYLYYKIKGYLCSNNNSSFQYKIPFDTETLKNNSGNINKVIFALNNMPDTIHHLLFGDQNNISFNYYYIRLDLEKKELNYNLEGIDDDINNVDIEYIFIRLNLINRQDFFDHVNGIYINKNKKYVLIFEPKVKLSFDAPFIEAFMKKYIHDDNYKFIYAEDLGYNIYNKIQNYDLFCQTYVLFVFSLIILNDNMIEYNNYSTMFNDVINSKNIEYFLYYIDILLQKNGYEICDQPELWTLSQNNFIKIKNIINYIITNKKTEDNNCNIREEDDLFIVYNYNEVKSVIPNPEDGSDNDTRLISNKVIEPFGKIISSDMLEVNLLDE